MSERYVLPTQEPVKGELSLSGTVINRVSQEPVKYAAVELRLNSRTGVVLNTSANASGEFNFSGLPAGPYTIFAVKPHFYMGVSESGLLGPSKTNVLVKMEPLGTISG